MDKSEKTILLIVLAVLVSCLCISLICGAVLLVGTNLFSNNAPVIATTNVPQVASTATVQPTATNYPQPVSDASETLLTLENTDIPTADLVILVEKFSGKKGIPLQLTTPPVAYEIGDQLNFQKLNVDTNENVRITATLRYATESVYFWAEEGIDLDVQQLKTMVDRFATKIYPTDQKFFGKEWIPGVDNDPHLYILYATNLGAHLAGYSATIDSVLPEAHEYSNAHEMFAINADVQTLTDPYTLSVMAHEFQHLIHGYHDPNEELWLNEGFSELATLLNGYDAGGFDYLFAISPDIQLNDWSMDVNENDIHYGASFLYVTYLLDRFGDEITRGVVADPLNGFASIDEVFKTNHLVDSVTGKAIAADDLFVDWTITNYLMDAGVADGRYTYSNYPNAPKAQATETISSCDGIGQNRTVRQYGTDYIEVDCPNENIRLHFSGSPMVPVLPVAATDGKFMWSNRADSSATSLSREFDFSKVSGPITFTYRTWYNLEKDYDYLYLLASENGLDNEILRTPSCTILNPSGNSYGCGYNGSSLGWVTESVDLSKFAGKKVTLSFEYITDGAVYGEGLILDDMQIPEIGYTSNFESDSGGWEAHGFARIGNAIPQTFLVSVISSFGSAQIQKFTLDSGEVLDLNLDPLPTGETYIIVVSGSSRFTRQEAQYQIILQ